MLNRATTFIAFTLGLLLVGLFHKYVKGMGYNNAFTTGNLKKSVVAWSAYFFGEDKSQHNAAVNYMFLVIAFALGAIVSALLQKIFVLKTIWFAVLLLGAINIVYTISLNKRKKLSFSKNE